LWSLIFQSNVTLNEGDLIENTEVSNILNFQPPMPVPIGKDSIWIGGPVICWVYAPKLDPSSPDGTDGHDSGFGDIQMLNLFGPMKSDGSLWGFGADLDVAYGQR
jgi:hypothetical protein